MKIKIADILLWIMFIATIIVVLWYIFGNSPTIEQTLLILILTLSITTIIKVSVLETRFNYLARDFRNHCKHK